jgi:uncharacterized protein YegL
MSKLITKVAVVLDKSGSMKKRRQQAIDSYNEQVQQIRLNSKEQEIRASLVTFNGTVTEHLWNQPAASLQDATFEDYDPEGGTAMRDAIAYVAKKWLAEPDCDDENVTHLIIAITDGESYNDKEYNHQDPEAIARYRKLIEGCEARDNWAFTMMGCSKEYLIQLSRETGTAQSNLAAFDASSAAGFGYANKELGKRTDNYLKKRAMGVKGAALNCNYMSESAEVANFVPPQDTAAVPADVPPVLGGPFNGPRTNLFGGPTHVQPVMDRSSWVNEAPQVLDEAAQQRLEDVKRRAGKKQPKTV